MLLQPQANARQVICLDLASTEFRGALINLNGELQHRINIPINDCKGEAALNRMYVLIDSLTAAARSPLLGIGVGTPGLVSTKDGRILQAVNLGWNNLPLGELLAARCSLPTYILNDSHAAALAEYTYQMNASSQNMILIKSGQGIGAGLIVNGQIFSGDGFAAGEIGHLQAVENGPACSCGKNGCLETVVSNRALIKQAVTLGRLDPNDADRPAPEIFLRLTEAHRQGDKAILRLVHETGKYFGTVIASLASILNINQIVISGAVTAFGSVLMDGIQQQIHEQVMAGIANQIQVSFSKLEDDGVMLGVGALTVDKELGIYA